MTATSIRGNAHRREMERQGFRLDPHTFKQGKVLLDDMLLFLCGTAEFIQENGAPFFFSVRAGHSDSSRRPGKSRQDCRFECALKIERQIKFLHPDVTEKTEQFPPDYRRKNSLSPLFCVHQQKLIYGRMMIQQRSHPFFRHPCDARRRKTLLD